MSREPLHDGRAGCIPIPGPKATFPHSYSFALSCKQKGNGFEVFDSIIALLLLFVHLFFLTKSFVRNLDSGKA